MESIKIKENFINEEDAVKSADDTLKQIFNQKLMTNDTIKSVIKYFQNLENQNNIEVFNRIEQTISSSQVSLIKIKEILGQIVDLELIAKRNEKEWTKLTKDINSYGENLNKMMICNKNISLLKKNIDIYFKNIVANQVEDLRKLMNASEKNIVFVYKNIRYLSYLRKLFLNRVKTLSVRSEKLNTVADHLMKVKDLEIEFFNKFFSYFEDIITIAEENPMLLVKLLRLVEEDAEFIVNIKLQLESEINKKKVTEELLMKKEKRESSAMIKLSIGGSSYVNNKIKESIIGKRESKTKISNFNPEFIEKNNLESQKESIINNLDEDKINFETIVDFIISSIHNRFEEDFKDKSSINLVLDSTLEYSSKLVTVHKKVVPCFPKHYEIFDVYKTIYLNEIHHLISPFIEQIQNNPQENSANTILLARWLDKFDEQLKSIGIEISYSDLGGEIKYVMNFFFEYISEMLEKNVETIISKNLQDKLDIKNNKNLNPSDITSYYASDIFKNVFGVVEALSGDIRGDMMLTINSIVIEKLMTMEKINQENVKKLSHPEDVLVACVYIIDADNCIEEFPSYRKKLKQILNENYHENLKARFNSAKKEYAETIRLASGKLIELIFFDIELVYLSKLFSSKWNDEVLEGVFDSFKKYFKGFLKIFKNQNILLMIIRSFIQQFTEYYSEEIIHSVRSIFRKEKKSKDPYHIFTYQFKTLKCLEDEENSSIKTEDVINSKTGNVNSEIKENKYDVKDNKHHKYNFPIKTLEESWKKPNFKRIKELIENDCRIFSSFLDGFKENAINPFSKFFEVNLDTFVTGQANKLLVMIKILQVEDNLLKPTIEAYYKEVYSGDDGRALLDALLYLRPTKVSEDLRKLCMKCMN